MRNWFPYLPEPPAWRADWAAVEAAFPEVRALQECPQDPVHHAEGDVGTHTRMVCEALAESPGFRGLPPEDRRVLFVAALLHDIGKPACTQVAPDGRITSPGHARRGSILAREILWRRDVPPAEREAVAVLVRWHQIPFHLLDRPDSRRLAITMSWTTRNDQVGLLAEADARGRESADRRRLVDDVALYREYCQEQGCFDAPYAFPSAHARFQYFRRPDRDPTYATHDDTRCEVILMSGLPGAGKDHWLAESGLTCPTISLDRIRAELRAAATGSQRAVIARAQEAARTYLRAGQDFVWNGTNLSRDIRDQCIGLFAAYNARVRIVYVEVPAERLFRQNRQRPSPVPEAAIARMIGRWEMPDLTEAHAVEYHFDDPDT